MQFDGQQGPWLILAHGAGAPMDCEPMERLVSALNDAGVGVVRFEFDYMAQRRSGGSKRPPPAQSQLLSQWQSVVSTVGHELGGEPLFIGGRSMGGRMASLLLAGGDGCSAQVRGGLVFGYPFHPPGKPQRWRTAHFPELERPLWIAQGERDPFGKRAELEQTGDVLEHLSGIYWVAGADHELKPTRRSGLDWQQALQSMALQARQFMDSQMESAPHG